MTAKIIDGEAIAKNIKQSIVSEINDLKQRYCSVPKLVAIQVGENPASRVYVKNQQQSCTEVGIDYLLEQLPENITEQELVNCINKFNNDTKVTGIIIQMPLPQHINIKNVRMNISYKKDVEGITPASLGMLVYSETKPVTAPCTALAVMELLKSINIPLKGKETVVVGHSEIVGKPITLMLLSSLLESATTTVCHIATQNLSEHTKRAEILIVAVGKPGLIKGEMIKEGAVVIDVGINRVAIKDESGNPVIDDKTGKPKMKTVGDVVYEECVQKASYITPVPGGVGPVTTSILLRNTLQLWKNQIQG